MAERVRITDVSPRDGLQNEPGVITTADKVKLVELLCRTGVDEVEVSSFVSAKWVPQLGDAAEVFAALHPLPEGGGGGRVPQELVPARNPVTVSRAQTLRKNQTGPERAMWSLLSAKQLSGFKFRRQHPFGPYILDFYCPEACLVVELDGRSHSTPEAKHHDATRTDYLQSHGLQVIRYSDDSAVNDPSAVAAAILHVLRSRTTPFPQPPPSRRGLQSLPVLSALVPNEVGMQAALDVNKLAQRKLIQKVSVFTAASETFSKKNTNASIAQTIDRFRPVIAAAKLEGLRTRGYISCIVACPFEGPIAPAAVADVAGKLLELGIEEIDLGDTIGAGTPGSITAVIRAVTKALSPLSHPPPSGRGLLTLHLHDTHNRAADCVRAALDLGVRSFDGSVAGLGGCPYASTPGNRAPGNISTELLVRTIEDAGYETGVDHDQLREAAAFASSVVARSRGSTS